MKHVILLLLLLPWTLALKAENTTTHQVESQIGFQTKALSLQYKQMDIDNEGYVANTTADSYLVLGGFDLPRDKACYLVLDAEFKQPMFRPGLFEAFWAVNPGAFSENQKARFLISHKRTESRHLFVVPLCKLYSFSGNIDKPNSQKNIVGLRFDYPMNRDIGLKIHKLDLISLTELTPLLAEQQVIELEPFERLSGKPFTSLDVAVPKVYFGLEHGWKRLTQDWPFMIVWLTMIFGLLILMIKGKRG